MIYAQSTRDGKPYGQLLGPFADIETASCAIVPADAMEDNGFDTWMLQEPEVIIGQRWQNIVNGGFVQVAAVFPERNSISIQDSRSRWTDRLSCFFREYRFVSGAGAQ